MVEKPRILGKGFKRKIDCAHCASGESTECNCDAFCGKPICSWRIGFSRRGEVASSQQGVAGPGVVGNAQAPEPPENSPGRSWVSRPEAPGPIPAEVTNSLMPVERMVDPPKPYRNETNDEIMAKFRQNVKGYPEFPPGTKLGPGVWDRKGVEPALRDLKAPPAELPEREKTLKKVEKRTGLSISDWS